MAGSVEYETNKHVPAGSSGSSGSSDDSLNDARPSSGGNSIGTAGPDSAAAGCDGKGSNGGPGGGPSGESRGTAGLRPPRRPIPPKLYRISELAAYAGTSRQTIHNYTTMGLLQESRWSEGGHRLYDETVFPRLDEILSMKAGRSTLKDIRDKFLGPVVSGQGDGAGESDASALRPPPATEAPPGRR
jgi:hypothetical protein